MAAVRRFARWPAELGYVEGTNVTYEYRWNKGRNDLYPALAAELAALPVDLILTIATPAAIAARNATSTIPIVMAPVGDPVKSGLAASMARPGGNLTDSPIWLLRSLENGLNC